MSVKITDPLNVMPMFVSDIVTSGYLNGIVNLKLAALRWLTIGDGKAVPELVVCADVRLDLACAIALRDRLDEIIADNTRPNSTTEH